MIDREPILPEGVARHHFIYSQGFGSPANPFLYPLYWEQGISDRITLVYMPLPLQIRYLLHRGEESWLAVDGAFLGPIYSRNKNFDWRPTGRIWGRRKIGADWALEAEGLALIEITRDGVGNPGTTFGTRLSAWHQLSNRLALSAGVWVQREDGTTRARYVGALPPGNEGIESEQVRWRYPLSFQAQLALHRQWELALALDLFRLGYPAGYTGSSFFASILHSW